METNKTRLYIEKIGKIANKHRSALIIGGVLGFSLASVYLLFNKRRNVASSIKPNQETLNMERYVFDIFTDNGTKEAIVENSGECYAVTLDGKYIGSMWRDEERGMQWNTVDEDLVPHLWDIAAKLSEAFSRKGFPSLLKGTYSEIVSTHWKTSETLEVIISQETDLEVFSTFLKDEILNIVDFEEHLDLIVKKEDNSYFVLVGIN